MKLNDLTGKRFGYLVVTGRGVRPVHLKNRETYWEVLCLRCGRTSVVMGNHLKMGLTRSCGCLRDSYYAHLKAGIPWTKGVDDHTVEGAPNG